jgi:hypothetical protein
LLGSKVPWKLRPRVWAVRWKIRSLRGRKDFQQLHDKLEYLDTVITDGIQEESYGGAL